MISKLPDMRRGEDKCGTWKMHSKIRELQNKIISTIDTHIKKKSNPNTTLKIVSTPQEKTTKEDKKKTQSNNSKQLTKWQ